MRFVMTIKFLAFGFWILGACAAPQEPASLQSSGSNVAGTKQKGQATKAASVAVNYGGAAIGDEEMRAEVQKCLTQGKFYERRDNPKPGCTTYKLAEISCTDATITSIMDDRDKAAYLGYQSRELAGFVLDQCLDCSSPVGNAMCEGNGQTKVKDPGTRLFLVKQTGSVIDIRTIYVSK